MEKRSIMLVAAVVLGILIIVIGIASQPKQATREEAINRMFSNVDQAEVDKLGDTWHATEAEQRGDTYCPKCKKVNPGRVRICKYCGQYIN